MLAARGCAWLRCRRKRAASGKTTLAACLAVAAMNQCPTNARSPRAGEASAGLQMLGVLAEPMLTQSAEFQDAIAGIDAALRKYGHPGVAALKESAKNKSQ